MEARQQHRAVHVVGICGASASGKSVLAKRLVEHDERHGRGIAAVEERLHPLAHRGGARGAARVRADPRALRVCGGAGARRVCRAFARALVDGAVCDTRSRSVAVATAAAPCIRRNSSCAAFNWQSVRNQ